MTDPNHVYALACAGGGAHGAYQVGVLKYIHEHFCNGDASPFRIFSGTSAGSLNTSFFACRSFDARIARLELEERWRDFDVPDYHGNVLLNTIREALRNRMRPRNRRKSSWSLLDPNPLVRVVERGFNREALDQSFAQGTTLAAAFSATELRSSSLVWFNEGPAASKWHSDWARSIETRLDAKHVVASCSVPFAFPPVKIGEHYYSDGGVANKLPFGPAIRSGATRILSVATDRPLPADLPTYPDGFKPRARDVVRMLGGQLSSDYATNQAMWIEVVNYFREKLPPGDFQKAGEIGVGGELNLSKYCCIEVELFAPSRRIGHTDIFDPEYFDPDEDLGSTVLRFRQDFVVKLINFGYEDAANRHDRLAWFFDRERPVRPSILSEASTSEAPDCKPEPSQT